MLTPKPFRVFSSIFNTKDTKKKTKISLSRILKLAEKQKILQVLQKFLATAKIFYFCGLNIILFLVLFVLKNRCQVVYHFFLLFRHESFRQTLFLNTLARHKDAYKTFILIIVSLLIPEAEIGIIAPSSPSNIELIEY